ncbi:hypothetical protein JCGZ_02464 [Jatropha curcas]|uniref:Uncharacterized protein n=1 Tax=Jatropha curcas TaxID=180498 RepID=A0A067JT29_JATCU|nr:hypothetical protein JCGZ_02464 [Jatropha curcas]
MTELIGIDLPRIDRPSHSTPDLSVSRHWLSLQAPDIYARHRQGELTATQVPDDLISQMMELILGMQEELTSAWTLQAFDDRRRRRSRR